MTLLLSEKDVAALVNMPAVLDLTEGALRALSAGQVNQPVRAVSVIAPESAFMAAMPAYLHHPPALGTKLVTVFPHNKARGISTHLAVIALNDPHTGAVLALLDGRLITEMRTAAASAVATRAMANPAARVLALLGAGAQAESHLEAIALVRPLQQVYVWNRSAERAAHFAQKMAHLGIPITIAPNAQAAVAQADIIATVSAASEPILKAAWLKSGVHINAVGSARPNMRELDSATLQAAYLIVDKREAALQEAGDILIPMQENAITADAIRGELGEVVAGGVVARPSTEAITLFKSLGQAVEDVAVARWVYEEALRRGLGVVFDFQ